jgi:hypothetical protein
VVPLGVPQDPGRARLLRPPPRPGGLPYANICEQCDNFVPAPEFAPALVDQLVDVQALQADAEQRGWTSEVERHSRVIQRLQEHLGRLNIQPDP